MKRILITGATGNVGIALIQALNELSGESRISAGVRSLEERNDLLDKLKIPRVRFDFSDADSIKAALADCDVLFLLRPPQLSSVEKYFRPVIQHATTSGVQHIVFLSVQGVERSTIIPHHKIEALIVASGICYTFLRPAYFMQNFTTTLRKDIVGKSQIYLPSGKAKFTVVDVRDVANVAAVVLMAPEKHQNVAYDITNDEQVTFAEMAGILSDVLRRKIRFKSPDLISFFLTKRKENVPPVFILVMIMLHYLPRFQRTPLTSSTVKDLTGNEPKSFCEFVEEHRLLLARN